MWLHSEIDSLADIPRHWARKSPDHPAIIDPLGTRTFADLDRSSNRIASALGAAGIKPGSHVGFFGKNSARYFEILFGANKAGCAVAPLNWRLTAAELVPVIEDAECPLIFVDREFAQTVQALAAASRQNFVVVVFDAASAADAEFEAWLDRGNGRDPAYRIHPNDTAVLTYTSGTTGRPKGVELTHRGFNHMRLCEHLEPAYEWHDKDVLLTVMPVFHLVGTGLSVQALYNGVTVSVLPVLDPAKLFALLKRDRPTICCLVPTAIQMILDHPEAKGADFSSLRLVMYAGSPITATLLKRALTQMGCQFMQFYGATESSGAITLLRPEQHDLQDEAKLRSCGTPLPLIEVRIVDGDGRDVAPGQTGEFWVRGPNIFRGYWKQPEATAAVLQNGWYRSGDAGYRDKDGLLYIVDRVKDMIVTGGENVYSAEVEQALAKHPGVKQSAVIGVPDPKWGEKVTAVVIRSPGVEVSAEEIITHCRSLIAGYKVPKQVHFVEAMPMTATGKVLKRAVRDEYWKGFGRSVG